MTDFIQINSVGWGRRLIIRSIPKVVPALFGLARSRQIQQTPLLPQFCKIIRKYLMLYIPIVQATGLLLHICSTPMCLQTHLLEY